MNSCIHLCNICGLFILSHFITSIYFPTFIWPQGHAILWFYYLHLLLICLASSAILLQHCFDKCILSCDSILIMHISDLLSIIRSFFFSIDFIIFTYTYYLFVRTCAGCKYPIGHGRFLSCMNAVWHPQCFRCFACNKPISEYEV